MEQAERKPKPHRRECLEVWQGIYSLFREDNSWLGMYELRRGSMDRVPDLQPAHLFQNRHDVLEFQCACYKMGSGILYTVELGLRDST